ncbi:protein NDR1-like [Abeliophyllum distichum]|uniref:Protein NDR1-like n=1 Tax=Abeliophyllum distichum TaxID=126358 RepID=A0ABD1VSK5_9LAMI
MEDNALCSRNVNLTLFNGPNATLPIANYTVPVFRQGKEEQLFWSLTWDDAIKAVSNESMAFFRVDLVVNFKTKQLFWSKEKKMVMKAIVEVNDSGEKVHQKPIRLKSTTFKWIPGISLFLGFEVIT